LYLDSWTVVNAICTSALSRTTKLLPTTHSSIKHLLRLFDMPAILSIGFHSGLGEE